MSTPFARAGHTFQSNGGNSVELYRAARVATAVAKAYQAPTEDFFLSDHTHEELPIGSASIGWEGVAFDWPYTWSQTAEAQALARTMGVTFEAINGCILGIYPAKD